MHPIEGNPDYPVAESEMIEVVIHSKSYNHRVSLDENDKLSKEEEQNEINQIMDKYRKKANKAPNKNWRFLIKGALLFVFCGGFKIMMHRSSFGGKLDGFEQEAIADALLSVDDMIKMNNDADRKLQMDQPPAQGAPHHPDAAANGKSPQSAHLSSSLPALAPPPKFSGAPPPPLTSINIGIPSLPILTSPLPPPPLSQSTSHQLQPQPQLQSRHADAEHEQPLARGPTPQLPPQQLPSQQVPPQQVPPQQVPPQQILPQQVPPHQLPPQLPPQPLSSFIPPPPFTPLPAPQPSVPSGVWSRHNAYGDVPDLDDTPILLQQAAQAESLANLQNSLQTQQHPQPIPPPLFPPSLPPVVHADVPKPGFQGTTEYLGHDKKQRHAEILSGRLTKLAQQQQRVTQHAEPRTRRNDVEPEPKRQFKFTKNADERKAQMQRRKGGTVRAKQLTPKNHVQIELQTLRGSNKTNHIYLQHFEPNELTSMFFAEKDRQEMLESIRQVIQPNGVVFSCGESGFRTLNELLTSEELSKKCLRKTCRPSEGALKITAVSKTIGEKIGDEET